MSEVQFRDFTTIMQQVVNHNFDDMKLQKHHMGISIYEHCVKVAFLCYKYSLKYNLNASELIRAALLHDYFLYDRRNKASDVKINRFIHCFKHPNIALHNTLLDYPNLSLAEQDAIKKHMFPLTVIPPRTSCGWVVCWCDKIVGLAEYFHVNPWKQELNTILDFCKE